MPAAKVKHTQPNSIERKLKKLLRPDIQTIKIAVSSHGFSVWAEPNGFHPLVRKRREEAFATASDRADGAISITQASEINKDSLGAVGRGFDGRSLEAALTSLEADIKKHDSF